MESKLVKATVRAQISRNIAIMLSPRKCEFSLPETLGLPFLPEKKYFYNSFFLYANPLPLRSMELQRNMAGTSYRASLPKLLLNLESCLAQRTVPSG